MKKNIKYILIITILFIGLSSPVIEVRANPPPPPPDTTSTTPQTNTFYHPLVPFNGEVDSQGNIDVGGTNGTNAFGKYLNVMIKIFIGLCAVLAMVMIVMGGIEYMTSELISSKEAGKERITNAIFGLLLALGAYTLLNTINPDLLNTTLDIQAATLALGGESSAPFTPIINSVLQSDGVYCPETIGASALQSVANSFSGRSTYDQTKRGQSDSSTLYLDCSSFVSQVYFCAGVRPLPGDNTGDIFGSDTITVSGTQVNGIELQVGDLLGWKAGESTKYVGEGHVVMYMGGGNVIEAHGPSGVLNGAIRITPLSTYQGEYKHIKRVSSAS